MTVSAQTLAFEYTANGVTTTFPYQCRILFVEQLKVYVNGVIQVGGYTVFNVGNQNGGDVVFSVAPAAGSTVLIRRISDRVRTTDFQQAPYFTQEELLDLDQDYQTMLLQEAAAEGDKSIKIPSEETVNTTLPGAAERAGKQITFGANGEVQLTNTAAAIAGADLVFAPTKAAADSLAASLPDGATVIVDRDETRNYERTRYTVASAALTSPIDDTSFVQAGTGAVPRTSQDKARESVTAQDFGAIADGVSHPLSERFATLGDAQAKYPCATALTDEIDWAAIQHGLDNGFDVLLLNGDYKINKSISLYEGSVLRSESASSATVDDAKVKLSVTFGVKSDLFVWKTAPVSYVFGVRLEGFTLRGYGAGIGSVINLPLAYGLDVRRVNGYAGFDTGVVINGWLDCYFDHCSFQGFSQYGILGSNASGVIATTVTFNKCYFSQGGIGVYLLENTIVSLHLVETVIESVDKVLIQDTGNHVFFNDLHCENVPRTDGSGEVAFVVGLTGSTSYPQGNGTLSIDGFFITGYQAGTPTNTLFMATDKIDRVSISNGYGAKFKAMLSTTVNTIGVDISTSTWDDTSIFSSDVYDIAKINFRGFRPSGMLFPSDGNSGVDVFSSTKELASADLELPFKYGAQDRKMYNEKSRRKLRYRDYKGNDVAIGNLLASSEAATFNGALLNAGEMLYSSVAGAGNPVGYISQLFSKDVAVTVTGAATTSGSPVLTKAGTTPFINILVDDWVTVSAGMASSTFQYRVIEKAADSSSITLNSNATSTTTGDVVVPAHVLLPFGQQGYRSYGASPIGVFVPKFVGEELLDTANVKWYKSTGLTTADWVALN